VSASKQKGTFAETLIVRYLRTQFPTFEVDRLALHGRDDRGDVRIFGVPCTIEVKNCARMQLAEWVDEAEAEGRNASTYTSVVWHKRKGRAHPSGWYVTMSGRVFVYLLAKAFGPR
jgi:hypothetical protein